MGWFIILLAGLIGLALFWERKFHYCWKILLTLCFSLYIAVFLAPVIMKLFNISGFYGGVKSAVTMGGIFLITGVVMLKISDRILPDSVDLPLPSWFVVFNAVSGFCIGILTMSVIIYLSVQTFLSNVSSVKGMRAPSAKTIIGLVDTLNFLSCQDLTPEGKTGLRTLRLIPKQKKPKPEGEDNAVESESKPESSAVKSNEPAGKKDKISKTFLKRKIKLSQEIDD